MIINHGWAKPKFEEKDVDVLIAIGALNLLRTVSRDGCFLKLSLCSIYTLLETNVPRLPFGTFESMIFPTSRLVGYGLSYSGNDFLV